MLSSTRKTRSLKKIKALYGALHVEEALRCGFKYFSTDGKVYPLDSELVFLLHVSQVKKGIWKRFYLLDSEGYKTFILLIP